MDVNDSHLRFSCPSRRPCSRPGLLSLLVLITDWLDQHCSAERCHCHLGKQKSTLETTPSREPYPLQQPPVVMILCSISFYVTDIWGCDWCQRVWILKRILNLVLGLAALALFLLLGYISAEVFGSAWWWGIDEWSAVVKVISRNIKGINKEPGIML